MSASAEERNRIVEELAAVVVQAGKGSKTEEGSRVVMRMGKGVWTLDAAEHGQLVAMGARRFTVEALPSYFAGETRIDIAAAPSQLDRSRNREA